MIDIIVVNWNGGEGLSECIDSIAQNRESGLVGRVVVVDNASTDGSVETLDAGGLPLTVIRNQTNRGFAAACNQGARGSTSEYLLFLNPDARLLPDSLQRPLRVMQDPASARIGITGIQLLDERGRVSRSCARFPTPSNFLSKALGLDRIAPRRFPDFIMSDWAHDETREVDHVIGAFFLVRRCVFEELNGFDERFFVYLEDLDFSYRAAQSGWRSLYLADTQAYHKGGGTSEQVRAKRLFYSLRSRIQYADKHFGRGWALRVALGTMLFEPLIRLVWAAVRGSGREMLETVQGYALLWGNARMLWTTADQGRA